jgi:cell division protein FtsB
MSERIPDYTWVLARLKAERDEARAEVARLREALEELLGDYTAHMQENAYTEQARAALRAATGETP